MATKATTLFALATVKAWLAVTDASDDARITRVADAVTERIESVTDRLFVTRTLAETYDGDGTRRLFLRRYPVVSIATLTVKDTPTSTATSLVESTDYDADKRLGRIVLRSRSFTKGFQNVAAGYDAGYGVQDAITLPQDVVQAGLDYVKLVWTELTTGAISATSINVGPSSMVLKPGMPWSIKQALDGWIRRKLL